MSVCTMPRRWTTRKLVRARMRLIDSAAKRYSASSMIRMQAVLHDRGWRPSWAEVLHLSLGISAGLQAVHQAGLVHRDVKPGNILMDSEGACVLSDFGLADHLDNLSTNTASAPSGGFHKQRIVGTMQYLAPEVLLNHFHTQVRHVDSRPCIRTHRLRPAVYCHSNF